MWWNRDAGAVRAQPIQNIDLTYLGTYLSLPILVLEELGTPRLFQGKLCMNLPLVTDPALYQSGKIDRKGKISKRGNRHLRRIIWLMTTKVIQFNERFKQYYLKRIKDGLPYKMAVLATAHKLIRVMFAMSMNKTLFNPRMN